MITNERGRETSLGWCEVKHTSCLVAVRLEINSKNRDTKKLDDAGNEGEGGREFMMALSITSLEKKKKTRKH